jgi:hypothetical protein
MEDDNGENRIPDKKIGEVAHAEEQAERITGHKAPHGPGAPLEKESVRGKPGQDPSKKDRRILTALNQQR